MHVHLDPIGGIAGDMFIAALLDAWPEYSDELFTALNVLELPPELTLQLEQARQHGIQGLRFSVALPADAQRFPSGRYAQIRERIQQSKLTSGVRQHTLGIFQLLAEAEARVHGIAVDDVHFHELADWDSIIDIVSAAWLIERIGAKSWSVAPLPLGSGLVNTEHGPLPVPAPATTLLLQGLETRDDGIPGERVTPTGAAILQYLKPGARTAQSGVLQRQGFGLGSRTLPDRANVLRMLAWENVTADLQTEQIIVIEFEIDDQTGEDLALALDRLRALEGVLDIGQMPYYGKKGRLAQHIQILAHANALDEICRHCLIETTTLGLRWRTEQRLILSRELRNIEMHSVKIVLRPDGSRTAKTDISTLHGQAGHKARAEKRRDLEQKALHTPNDD